jgi:protein SCO1/2
MMPARRDRNEDASRKRTARAAAWSTTRVSMNSRGRALGWIVAVVALGAVIVFGARIWQPGGDDAPAGADVPKGRLIDFACVERSGRAMRTSEFAGRFVVADFVFTSCSGMCPALASEMKKVQEATAARDDVRIVSFTVDPERDRPAVMAKYADEHGFDKERWLFLRAEIADLKAFMVGELGIAAPTDIVLHTDRFVLFDTTGAARAIYSPLDDSGWQTKLLADVERMRPAGH